MMAFPESTAIVINRIKQIEPENALRIVGYLLAKSCGEQDMIRLAMSPDHLFHQFILKVKTEVQHLDNKRPVVSSPLSIPVSPSMNPTLGFTPFPSPVTFRTMANHWDPHLIVSKNMPLGFSESSLELQNQTQPLCLERQVELVNSGKLFSGDYYYPDAAMSNNLSARARRKFSSMSESSVKTCHYFNKGFCKHGSSCRFNHDQVNIPESFSHVYGNGNGNDGIDEDHRVFSPGSLEKLELDIIDILKSRRGNPVSIASLPSLYYEKCGKNLQAEGYLTESQRHGKVGNYSLTRLISRMKHIKLIDRPHGQHAVILKEDLHMYHDRCGNDQKSDPGPIVSGSRQIYLTFPAESTFIEYDVSNYFSIFGPVEDVRIPCQEKRMFGFVTFVSSDTVKIILAKGNPHFVCGARVLVKPYREKSKLVIRKYPDRVGDSPVFYSPFYSDMDSEFQSMSLSRGYENTRLLRKQLMEEQEQAIEPERRQIAEFQLMRKIANNQPSLGYSRDMLKLSEDNVNFQSIEPFSYLLDVIKSDSTSDDEPQHRENYTEHERSEVLNLPDNPFAPSSIATGVPTVV